MSPVAKPKPTIEVVPTHAALISSLHVKKETNNKLPRRRTISDSEGEELRNPPRAWEIARREIRNC